MPPFGLNSLLYALFSVKHFGFPAFHRGSVVFAVREIEREQEMEKSFRKQDYRSHSIGVFIFFSSCWIGSYAH